MFDFVLHHLVGQGPFQTVLAEANPVLRPRGYIVAREPSSYSPSGLVLKVANAFRLMHVVSGASNYEFALSPPKLIRAFSRRGSVLNVQGLTNFFSHRLPVWAQKAIAAGARMLEPLSKTHWFADFVLYVVRKDAQPGRSGG